jgi:cobalamin biosynthesis protein CobD/CbiB
MVSSVLFPRTSDRAGINVAEGRCPDLAQAGEYLPYAVTLGVQLGGLNTYRGVKKIKPILGIPNQSNTPGVIRSAGFKSTVLLSLRMLVTIGLGYIM